MNEYLAAFIGGLLIGLASLMLMLFNGRILGISGIIGGTLQRDSIKNPWRQFFILGLFSGGLILTWLKPDSFEMSLSRSTAALVVAGLLVGFGTRIGGGCTSGHGICGISRFSVRSIAATLVFMLTGAAVVFAIQHFGGGHV